MTASSNSHLSFRIDNFLPHARCVGAQSATGRQHAALTVHVLFIIIIIIIMGFLGGWKKLLKLSNPLLFNQSKSYKNHVMPLCSETRTQAELPFVKAEQITSSETLVFFTQWKNRKPNQRLKGKKATCFLLFISILSVPRKRRKKNKQLRGRAAGVGCLHSART